MKRPQAAKRDPRQIEVEERKCQFAGDIKPNGETRETPYNGRDGRELDRAHIVVGLAIDGQRRGLSRTIIIAADYCKHRRDTGCGE